MLNRPGVSCVEPRNTAANAGSRRVPPKLSEGPFSDEDTTPAKAAIVADAMSDSAENRSTRTPDRRAASVLPPMAYR